MAASSSDKISQASNGGIPVVATVQAARASGVTSLTVDTQQYWPTTTGVKFSTFKLDTNSKVVAGSQADWKGVSNGSNQLSNIVLVGGTATDLGNAIGDKVRMAPTAAWGDDIAQAFLLQHSNPNGAHTNVTATTVSTTGPVSSGGLLTSSAGLNVTAGPVTLPDSSITANELSSGAITLGYVQSVTAFTATTSSNQQVPGLSLTVNIPTGGRKIKITAFCVSVLYGNSTINVTIWDGPVGTGTQIAGQSGSGGTQTSVRTPYTVLAVVNPAAGSKTYNVGISGGAGSIFEASNIAPAFLLVEAI